MKRLFETITLIIVIAISLFILHSKVLAQQSPGEEQWREDLQHMSGQLKQQHKNLFHSQSEASFDAAVYSLYQAIPDMQDHEIIVALARIANAVGDGHSGMRLWADPAIAFRSYPIQLHWLEDGVFVKSVPAGSEKLLGARVTHIGEATIAEAIAVASPLVARDNDFGLKPVLPALLVMPEVLHALKLTTNMEHTSFTFRIDGKPQKRTLSPAEGLSLSRHTYQDKRAVAQQWKDANRSGGDKRPLYLQNPDKPFAYTFIEENRTAYIQINQISNAPDESLPDFAKRVFADIDQRKTDRVVVDIRMNGGGNNYLTRPIIKEIIRRPQLDYPGKLFCIIGNRTFSAAQNFTNRLELWTNVIFVGEPTSQNVNLYGDTQKIILPNSGITVRASYLWWQDMDPRDTRQWTAPNIYTPLTSTAYHNNSDPAMEAILNFDPTPLAEKLVLTARAQGYAAAKTLFTELKSSVHNRYRDMEDEINQAGYRLLGKPDTDTAILLFTLNTDLYPESWNSYDSLAEAYMIAGSNAKAIENYRKSLELNPGNVNGRDMISKIQESMGGQKF